MINISASVANPNKDYEIENPADDSISSLAFSPASIQANYLVSGILNISDVVNYFNLGILVLQWLLSNFNVNLIGTLFLHVPLCWLWEGNRSGGDEWFIIFKKITYSFTIANRYWILCLLGSWDNNVRCWEIDNTGKSIPKAQQTMQGPILDVCWHDDGSKVC